MPLSRPALRIGQASTRPAAPPLGSAVLSLGMLCCGAAGAGGAAWAQSAPLTTIVSTFSPSAFASNASTTITSTVSPAADAIPATITSTVNAAAIGAIASAASATMPTVVVSTFNPAMPTTLTSTINPAAASFNPSNPDTIVSTISPAAPNRIVTTINTATLDAIAARVQPFSPNTLNSTVDPSTGTITTTITPRTAPTAAGATLGDNRIGTIAGQASIRVGRTVSSAIADRNGEMLTSDGALAPAGGEAAPAAARSYAPIESLQGYFPGGVLKPEPAASTPRFRLYGTGFGGGFSQTRSVRGSFAGGLIGLDAQLAPNLLVGAAAGGSTTRASAGGASTAATADIGGFNGSLYAIAAGRDLYAQSVTTLSAFTNETRRSVAIGSGASETALFNSFEARERVEIGRVVTARDIPGLGAVRLVPFVAAEFASLRLDGHSETNVAGTGPSADLSTAGQTINDLPAFVGLRVERSFALGDGLEVTPILRLAYVHQFADAPVTASFAAASGATVFSANTTTLGRNAALVKAGAEVGLRPRLVAFANFDGLFSGDTSLYGGRAGIRYDF